MARNWTQQEYSEIVKLRNEQLANKAGDWKAIADCFGVSVENAVAAYRRAVGAKHGSYSSKTEYIPKQERQSNGENNGTTYEEGNDFINIVCASDRILSKEDIIEHFNIDLDVWEIERFKVKTSEGYRKDRQVSWRVEYGKVIYGDVEDTGKMLVVPLFHVEVRLIKKKRVYDAKLAINDLIEDAKKFSPKYETIKYPKVKDGLLYEIAMYDVHFGRLAWDEESGENFDIKLAEKAIKSSLLKLLGRVKEQPIEKILFPIGNDFFNVDSKFNTTTNGTPQQEDTRWQKTFRKGREICTWMIDTCSQIAPVDVIIIPGNHDQQRSFYLGEALSAWYRSCKNVSVNNGASITKYYPFGKVLLGFTHGNDIRLEKLPFMMSYDEPELWAKSKFREWHTGDKHHKKDLMPFADESSGMVIRIIRSLVAFDAWTFNSGYRSLRASESFLWHPEDGLVAQYTALPDME